MKIRRSTGMVVGALAISLMLTAAIQAAPPKSRPRVSKPEAKITTAQANSIALKKFSGKIVGQTKLENEEGTWQYGVMVRAGKTLREVMVNANTGKIDSVEVTTAPKEKAEARADAAKEKGVGKSGKAARIKPGAPPPKSK